MPLQTNKTSPENEIAAAMVAALQANPVLDLPEIHIDNPVDIDVAIEEMEFGHLLLDVWPYGIKQERLNRRNDEYTFEVHLGVRSKLKTVTRDDIDTLCFYRDAAQKTFGIKFLINLADGTTVHLIESEPFAPYGRKILHGSGLFVAPIRFAWKARR